MLKNIGTDQLRELYLSFFESKHHIRVPSAPLVPANDPSVLFTTAGMHPLVPYLKGEPHPAGPRLVDAQKCLRTTDIDEVGDDVHATVFEMLGNWSLGDYFKAEAISWSWEFLTSDQWLGLDPNYLAVSVFAGDDDAKRDEESSSLWKSLGVAGERITYLSKDDNWWPAGGKHPGPQGPDTEIFYWTGEDRPPTNFDPSDKNWVEIWNNVFMQFNRQPDGRYEPLPQKNVDTGMGLERTVMVLAGLKSIYEIDSYQPIMALISEAAQVHEEKAKRTLADHIKALTFILGDEIEVTPSNTDQGYVARRLIRRAVVIARRLNIKDIEQLFSEGINVFVKQYGETYPSLKNRQQQATNAVLEEIKKFDKALTVGFAEIRRNKDQPITGEQAFKISTTYAVPVEILKEYAAGQGIDIAPGFDNDFEHAMEDHKKKSRTAAAGKFKGGLADHSDKSIHYHTATHLLQQALRTTLGEHVFQKGSNITAERLRFDFSHLQKMSAEEVKAVEDLVNRKIVEDLPVTRSEMSVAEAKQLGALGLFEHKYTDKVSVYAIGDFSREICGGPHVSHTGELGKFKITKEESAGAGLRRIKAILE